MTHQSIVNGPPRYMLGEEPIIPILRVRLELHQAPADFEFYQKMLSDLISDSKSINWTFGNDTHDNSSRTLELNGPVGDVARLLTLIPTFYPDGQLKSESCVEFTRVGDFYDGNNNTYRQILEQNSPMCGFVTNTPADAPPPVMKDKQDDSDAQSSS